MHYQRCHAGHIDVLHAHGNRSTNRLVCTAPYVCAFEFWLTSFPRTFQCNGLALIISGFLSFGVGHAKANAKPNRWQLLMIIYAGLTLIVTVWFGYVFPDSPVKARFLTKEEKVCGYDSPCSILLTLCLRSRQSNVFKETRVELRPRPGRRVSSSKR